MPDKQFVDVRYRGLEIASRAKFCDFGPSTAYLETVEPMPVGTDLAVAIEDDREIAVRVIRVQEQVAGADGNPGVRVKALSLTGAVATWWSDQVTRADPRIPEEPITTNRLPEYACDETGDAAAGAPGAEPYRTPKEEEAAVAVQSTSSADCEGEDTGETRGKRRKRRKTRTQ